MRNRVGKGVGLTVSQRLKGCGPMRLFDPRRNRLPRFAIRSGLAEQGFGRLEQGAYQALVPTSFVISAPPLAVRAEIASIRSFDNISVIGTPATVEYRGSGTIVSPWPPRTNECTFSTETFSSIAMNVLMRAESSMPAIPITRSRGNLVRR